MTSRTRRLLAMCKDTSNTSMNNNGFYKNCY